MRKPFEEFKVLSPFTESVTITTANLAIGQDKAAAEILINKAIELQAKLSKAEELLFSIANTRAHQNTLTDMKKLAQSYFRKKD